MKYSLTVVLMTARHEAKRDWFYASLHNEALRHGIDASTTPLNIWIADTLSHENLDLGPVKIIAPKPTIWAGKHRITRENWWSKSSNANGCICLCRTDWIAFVDDRSVIQPGWLDCIAEAMEGNYAVSGAYEKRHSMTVENGVIKHGGIITARDTRVQTQAEHGWPNPLPHRGEWCFGCNLALPLEWCLEVNGFDETCDGISHEDSIFGMMVHNAGHTWKFDKRMMIVEDRTPGECGPVMRREDKGVSPNDKSHALVDMLKDRKRALNLPCEWDLRKIRADVLAGRPFPIPTNNNYADWWDGQPIKDFK